MVQKYYIKGKEDINVEIKILNVYKSHRWNIICNVIKEEFIIKSSDILLKRE